MPLAKWRSARWVTFGEGAWSLLEDGWDGAVHAALYFGGRRQFTLAWIGNRLVQSMGWSGLVKVCSQWFSYKSYGTVIGILSLSFLIGDAIAREWMGWLIGRGYGWRRSSISLRLSLESFW